MISSTKSDKEIAKLAYQFWEDEGRPEGRAEAHWLRATSEVNIPELIQGKPAKAVKTTKKHKTKG